MPCTVPPEALTMNQRIQFPVRIPFVEELGLELWAFGGGSAEVRVDLAEAHLNSWEVAHGGVLMTLLGQLRAIGRLLHKTSTLAFCEGHVHNGRGELCAHASGTFKYLRERARTHASPRVTKESE